MVVINVRCKTSRNFKDLLLMNIYSNNTTKVSIINLMDSITYTIKYNWFHRRCVIHELFNDNNNNNNYNRRSGKQDLVLKYSKHHVDNKIGKTSNLFSQSIHYCPLGPNFGL